MLITRKRSEAFPALYIKEGIANGTSLHYVLPYRQFTTPALTLKDRPPSGTMHRHQSCTGMVEELSLCIALHRIFKTSLSF